MEVFVKFTNLKTTKMNRAKDGKQIKTRKNLIGCVSFLLGSVNCFKCFNNLHYHYNSEPKIITIYNRFLPKDLDYKGVFQHTYIWTVIRL